MFSVNRPASLAAAILLVFIALAQLCRVIFGVRIIAAGFEIPIWPSAIAAIVLASLAIWLLKERSHAGR
jgi:MFS superfamily sulfate permease-like transporter